MVEGLGKLAKAETVQQKQTNNKNLQLLDSVDERECWGLPLLSYSSSLEEQEEVISGITKLIPEPARKIRQALNNVSATSLCTGKNPPEVMNSRTHELQVILMLLEVTANLGQTLGTLIDLGSDTSYVAHKAARRLKGHTCHPWSWEPWRWKLRSKDTCSR